MQRYCEQCNQLRDTNIKTVKETYKVKDVEVTVESEVRYCDLCGEELWDKDLDDSTLKKAYAEYKKREGLLSAEEMKEIRAKYDLSQSSFAKLLGFGEKTITRYENGAIQDKAQDNLIRLMSDIEVFKKLWDRNKGVLTAREIQRVEDMLHLLKTPMLSLAYPPSPKYCFSTSIRATMQSSSIENIMLYDDDQWREKWTVS